MTDRTKLILVALASTVLVVGVLLYPDLLWQYDGSLPSEGDNRIPPAFSGNRAAYAWALFSLFTIATMSVRYIIIISLEFRTIAWREAPDIFLYRLAIAGFCSMAFFGTAPEVALLLLWGDVTSKTLVTWMTIDRLGDGMAGIFFMMAITVVVRAEQLMRAPVRHQLRTEPSGYYEVVPRRTQMKDHLKIMGAITIIAAGLAVWK